MSWIMVGVAVVGTGIQIAGQLDQGKQDKATGETNRRIANAQADDAILRGTIEESKYRRYIQQIIGGQKAAFGARNVAVTGSALDLLQDTAMIGEEDAVTIRSNAAREAWGYRNQANEAARWGANQNSNAKAGAFGSLLMGGAKAYGSWAGG